jgi:adenosylcobinamide-phosphate synthase
MLASGVTGSSHVLFIVCALLVEAACGYPVWVYRAIGHPVTWIGAAIAWLDARGNTPPRHGPGGRLAGVFALALLLAGVGLVGWLVQLAAIRLLPGGRAPLVLGVLGSSLLAQRSLWQHVRAVETGLRAGLGEGRAAVSMIVGRNPAALDEAGVARAAIESLAENFSDGVVAPALWGALLGLPGILLYKAINTADSMIGHRTPRHLAFGWAAARLDDGVNLPASRLSALLLTVAALLARRDAAGAARAVRRDAGHHRSPNAGWPEAAMAGALGLRLAGPRVYGEVRVEDGWMGDGRATATAEDIAAALLLYRLACGVFIAGLIVVWAVVS